MKIFLAGASGVIGTPLLGQLANDGHEVTALTRSPDRISALREAGATSVAVGDALDGEALRAHVRAAEPEVVINQLTAIPKDIDPKHYAEAFTATNRLRTEGSRLLTEAAVATGVRRYIAQSIAFVYEPTDLTTPATESHPLIIDPPAFLAETVTALRINEQLAFTSDGAAQPFEGVVLRYGFFLGPDTAFRRGGALENMLRKRQFAIVGGGRARTSMVEIGDAARATALAVANPRAAGHTFNICCDDAPTAKEFARLWARELTAPRPLHAPAWLARRVAGDAAVFLATQVQPASNASARADLGWVPAYPTTARALRHMLDSATS